MHQARQASENEKIGIYWLYIDIQTDLTAITDTDRREEKCDKTKSALDSECFARSPWGVVICDRCQRNNPDNLMFCQECGKRLQAAVPKPGQYQRKNNICPRCLTTNPVVGTFCVACGARLKPITQPVPKPNDASSAEQQPSPDQSATSPPAQLTAAVVHVSPAPQPKADTATVTCARCQGTCDAAMRFCKFCGAVLKPQPPSALLQQEFEQVPQTHYTPQQSAVSSPVPVDSHTPYQAAAMGVREPASVEALGFLNTMTRNKPQALAVPQVVQPCQATCEHNDGASTPLPRLVLIGNNGKDESYFPLTENQQDIGRVEGTIRISEDRYMSPRHARLTRKNTGWTLRDLGSTNGTFMRIRAPYQLHDGDLLLLGVEVLRFELTMEAQMNLAQAVEHGALLFATPSLPSPARLVQRTIYGTARDVYHLHRAETVIGRELGDIVFTDDPYMSKRHAMISMPIEQSKTLTPPVTLQDLGSSNGTFVAIRDEQPLTHLDFFRVGQHLFRIELDTE